MRFFRALLFFVVIVGVWVAISKYTVVLKGKKIAVIRLEGIIDTTTPSVVVPLLKEALSREDIAGIILRINSPGGAVAPSQEIYRYILDHRNKKRIYASIGALGASGAYYVASACNRIYADSGSLVGSIGVIFTFSELKNLLEKVGIKPVVIKSGKFKDVGSPFREMTEEERKYIKGLIDEIHNQFVADVSAGRGISEDKIRKIADGRVFTGDTAKRVGLVDGVASFWEVVRILSKDLGYEEELDTVELRRKRGFLDALKAEVISFVRSLKEELLYEGGIR